MLDLLSAALAFALIMLFLSMLVSVVVEMIHRFMRQREKGLQLMLGHLYDRVLRAYVPAEDGAGRLASRKAFVDLMSVNRAPTGTAIQGPEMDRSSDDRASDTWFWFFLWNGRRLANLSVTDFMNRLGSSPFGDAIRAAVPDAAGRTPVLNDLAIKFNAFGDEASDFFRRRAGLFSVLVSIAVAYLVHVHPMQLVTTFIKNPEIAQKVIDIEAKLTEAKDPATASKADVEEMTKLLGELKDAGVPITWTPERLKAEGFYFFDEFLGIQIPLPCGDRDDKKPHPLCDDIPVDKRARMATLFWLLVGGLLVGLGSPFWAEAVKSITAARSQLTGTAVPAKKEEDGILPTPDAVEHFNAGAASRDAADGNPVPEPEDGGSATPPPAFG